MPRASAPPRSRPSGPGCAGASCWPAARGPGPRRLDRPSRRAAAALAAVKSPLSTDEPRDSLEDITSYNNYYEFGTGKGDPAAQRRHADHPALDGQGRRPGRQARRLPARGHPQGRSRSRSASTGCAASRRWSMVIPWVGFPLADLLKRVEPQGSAKYVAFETLVRPDEMPGQRGLFQALNWPYVEGLRLDEAMHPLTILAVGPLRRDPAEPERRADPAGRAVEVRLQEHQVDRADQPGRGAAADLVEPAERGRVRLLLQRESRGRPSALEPGDRAPDRRGRPVRQAPADPAVQRLCRAGGGPVRRHGPAADTTDDGRLARRTCPGISASARARSTSSAWSRRSGPSISA